MINKNAISPESYTERSYGPDLVAWLWRLVWQEIYCPRQKTISHVKLSIHFQREFPAQTYSRFVSLTEGN